MLRRLIAVAVLSACLSAASPAMAGGPVVEDQAGDANGTGTWEELLHVGALEEAPYAPGTAPVSYAPGDLRRAWITTDYRTETVGADGLHHVPVGVTFHLLTEAPFDPEGPTLLYNFDMLSPGGCDSHFHYQRAGGHFLSPATNELLWSMDTACTPSPDDENDPMVIRGIYRHSAWRVSTAGREIRISIPFATLQPWQLNLLSHGKSIAAFGASTQMQILINPFLDQTAMTGTFRIGQDVPEDVPCSIC